MLRQSHAAVSRWRCARRTDYRRGMSAVKRILADECCGAIIDYQDFFLAQIEPRSRSRLRKNMRNFARLLAYLRIPTIVTLERPVYAKGAVPQDIKAPLGDAAKVFEKGFFDLTKEKPIRTHLTRLKKKQIIVAGCETDVCVLQSCLGLLSLGLRGLCSRGTPVFVRAQYERGSRKAEGRRCHLRVLQDAIFRIDRSGRRGPHADRMIAKFGEFPDDLPEEAVR